MARRRGRLGAYLATSDYSGCTEYRSNLVYDYWGDLGTKREVLRRNLQEINQPLNDPYPVKVYRGPSYEQVSICAFEMQPQFIGNTSVPFPTNAALNSVINFYPGIGEASIGCTFIITGMSPSPHQWDSGGFWDVPGATWD